VETLGQEYCNLVLAEEVPGGEGAGFLPLSTTRRAATVLAVVLCGYCSQVGTPVFHMIKSLAWTRGQVVSDVDMVVCDKQRRTLTLSR
jgi:hypothetical protein